MTNTSKIRAVIAGSITALCGFISWLATVPPEVQSGILAPLVDIVPVTWRPAVGLITRLLSFVSGIYATYAAAHSGPQTPPKNPPTT